MVLSGVCFEDVMLLVSALILLSSFVLLLQDRMDGLITTFAWQSLLLVCMGGLQAYRTGQYELYFSAGLTFCLKVLFVPFFIRYCVRKLDIRHKISMIRHPYWLLVAACGLVLFCYHLIVPIKEAVPIFSNMIAIAMAVTLLGMLLLVTHHKAVSHLIGFMSMENGIFLAALMSVDGMPMVVELGIAFDVLVAAVLFGIFFFQIRNSIDSLDVDQLTHLREDLE